MRDYSEKVARVNRGIWHHHKFIDLDQDARMLFLYLVTSEQSVQLTRGIDFDWTRAAEECLPWLWLPDAFKQLREAGIVRWGDDGKLYPVDLLHCKPPRFSLGAMTGKARVWISSIVRRLVFERDGHKCVYCGATERLTLDHIVAKIRGGTDEMENLCTACKPCNCSKGAKPLEEWRPT